MNSFDVICSTSYRAGSTRYATTGFGVLLIATSYTNGSAYWPRPPMNNRHPALIRLRRSRRPPKFDPVRTARPAHSSGSDDCRAKGGRPRDAAHVQSTTHPVGRNSWCFAPEPEPVCRDHNNASGLDLQSPRISHSQSQMLARFIPRRIPSAINTLQRPLMPSS